jgi:hypothetical protein
MCMLGRVCVAVMVSVAWASVGTGQERHVADNASLTAAVAARAAARDADRAAIREALSRPEVRHVADRLGVDTERLSESLATVEDPELERVAKSARDANQAIVGGASTVTISTTTIIIGLLVLILIIVAVR